MKITIITLFPDLFDGFIHASKMDRAITDGYIMMDFINPRDFCHDRHQQVDDEIYGGNTGLLIKAQPMIDAVESAIAKGSLFPDSKSIYSGGGKSEKDQKNQKTGSGDVTSDLLSNNVVTTRKLANSQTRFLIIYPSPSQTTYNQTHAVQFGHDYDHLIFVCGRYEGIDHRFDQYMQDHYPEQFCKISLGQFVVFGGETPSMVMIESIVRLLPGVITHFPYEESYDPSHNLSNLEYPQYTRPQDVYGYTVPEVLLSGHHVNIQKWNKENSQEI